MKYRYRNVKTGEVINTTNRIGGKNWERVEEEPALPPEDDFEETTATPEDDFEETTATPEDDFEETEEETAEPPVEKPAVKSSRKGKK